jgi:endonuclease/exonuclease/phosphatase family metal-dependent hydrolase
MANTRAVYRHVTTGEQVSKTIRNTATTTTCDNIGPSEQIEIFSVYRFDNCLDDIQSKSIFKTTDHLVDVKVMQFNVKNEVYTWSNRSTQIANLIKDNGIEIMGLQELYSESAYNTLLEKLGSNYAGIVYKRESSMFDTESEAIIYRKDKYTIVNSGRFWLTSTPDTAGKTSVDGYTAKYERFAIWSVLKNISYGNELCFTTAHIDNSNGASDGENLPVMTYQVGVMVNNVQARSGSVDNSNKIVRPIIIVGDFNANPDKNPIKTMLNKGYIDTFTSAQEKSAPANGPYDRATMHDNGTRNWAAFDYVFVKGGSPTVLKHQIHEHQYGGVTMSDHLAVAVTLRYQVKAE